MMAKKPLQLGRAVEWPDSPEKAVLDPVPNPQANTDYLVRFTVRAVSDNPEAPAAPAPPAGRGVPPAR